MANALMVCATGTDGTGALGLAISQVWPVAKVNKYFVMANTSLYAAKSTEANSQITYRTDGVLNTLYVRVTENSCGDANTVIRTRKNATNGNQNVTIAAGLTGEFEDNINTDIVVAADADKWNYLVSVGQAIEIEGLGSISFSVISILFAATSNTSIRHAAIGFPDMSDGTTFYYALADSGDSPNHTEAKSKFDFNAGGIIKNLFVKVSSSTQTTGTIVRLKVNGIAATPDLKVTLGTTAIVTENITDEVSITANDDINFEVISINDGILTIEVISIEFISTEQKFHSICARSTGITRSANTTSYFPIGGNYIPLTIESVVKADMNIAATVSNLTLYVESNTIT